MKAHCGNRLCRPRGVLEPPREPLGPLNALQSRHWRTRRAAALCSRNLCELRALSDRPTYEQPSSGHGKRAGEELLIFSSAQVFEFELPLFAHHTIVFDSLMSVFRSCSCSFTKLIWRVLHARVRLLPPAVDCVPDCVPARLFAQSAPLLG